MLSEAITFITVEEILNVLPCDTNGEDMGDEDGAAYTGITCRTDEGEVIKLLLTRGVESCKNTYLLADAIRE